MSMSAVFIQVDADEAARIEADDSLAEALFEDPVEVTAGFAAMGKMTSAMQERMKAAGPQIVAQALSRYDARTRAALEQRLGTTIESLASGQGGEQLMKLMEARQARAAARIEMAQNRSQMKRLSLHKEWHGIHYLLCGQVEPDGSVLGNAVLGGKDLGDDEEGFSGYGPARLLHADMVKQISDALAGAQLEAEAAGRFDAGRMNQKKIYPGFRSSDLEGLIDGVRRLRAFYAEAAENGRAMVTCIV